MSYVATRLKIFSHCLPNYITTLQLREISLEHFFSDLHQDCRKAERRLWLPQALVHSHPCYGTCKHTRCTQGAVG